MKPQILAQAHAALVEYETELTAVREKGLPLEDVLEVRKRFQGILEMAIDADIYGTFYTCSNHITRGGSFTLVRCAREYGHFGSCREVR